MVRITVASQTLCGLVPRPAQDMTVLVPAGRGRTAKRRYTIRHIRPDAGEIDLDVFLHEPSGPGSRWAGRVQPGSAVELLGPRGKLVIPTGGGWHLLIGDEASLPAIGALAEALAGTTTIAVIEVGSELDQLPIAATEVHWLHRGTAPAGTARFLLPALAGLQAPDGDGHAYLLGERRTMTMLGDLDARLVGGAAQRFVKGYWTATPAAGG